MPRTIVKSIEDIMAQTSAADARLQDEPEPDPVHDLGLAGQPIAAVLARLEAEMLREARALRFENAASLRDRIQELRAQDEARR